MKTRRGAERLMLRFVILTIAFFVAGHKAAHACEQPRVYATIPYSSSGDESVSLKQFTITLSPTSLQSVTVPFSIDPASTAINGVDYSIPSYTVTFAPGESTKTVNVNIYEDALDENDETIVINLGQPTNAVLGWPWSASYTILDNDPSPTVTIQSLSSGNENVTSKTLMVSLSAVSGRTVTVPYTVSGTATRGTDSNTTSGTDYTINSNTLTPLTIPAGKSRAGIVLSVINDSIDEPNETVVVSLSTPNNGTLGSPSSSTYTIQDNDVSAPTGFTATRNLNDPTHGINLAWTDNSANETGYQLERSTDSINWSIFPLPANATSCQQSGLTSNTHYYYQVKALKSGAGSSYATADAWTATPPHLTSPSVNQYTVNLSWSAYDTHATSNLQRYDVYCGETTPTQCIGSTTNTSFAHQVNIGSKFNYYKIVAVTGSASVASDNIVNKTTAASSLSINSIANQSESAGDTTITVVLSPQSAINVTARLLFETTSSLAELGTNHDLTTKTATVITFTPPQTAIGIGIHVNNDDIAETSESAIFDILPISGAVYGTNYTRKFYIIDDDVPPIIKSFSPSVNVYKPELDFNVTSLTDPQRRIRIYKADPKIPISSMQIQKMYDNTTTYTAGSVVDSSYPEFGVMVAPRNLSSPQALNSISNNPTLTLNWTKNDDQVTSHLYAMESVQRLTSNNADGLMSDCLSKERTFETLRIQNGITEPLSLLSGSITGVSVAADCNVTTTTGYKALKVVKDAGSSVSIAYTLNFDERTTVQQHQDFLVSAWHRNNATGGKLSLQYLSDSGWTTAGLTTASSGGNQWQKLEFYARVPNSLHSGLRLVMQSCAGTSYWDELSLKKMIQANHVQTTAAYEILLTDSANAPTSASVPLAGYTCQATTLTTQTHTFTSLKDGTYYAHVRAVDVFGNRSGWTNLGYWEFDQMQPVEPVLSYVKSDPVTNPNYIRNPFTISGVYNGPFDSTGQIKIRITAEDVQTNAVCAETTITITSSATSFSCSNMSLPDGRYRFYAVAVRTVGGRSNSSGKSNQIYRTLDTQAPEFNGIVHALPVFNEANVNQVQAELAWNVAVDSGTAASGVDHYDLYTTTGTTVPSAAFASVSGDDSTTQTYTYSNLDRDTSQTLFAVKAVDVAGNVSSASGSRTIYGTPAFSGVWHVNDGQWATSLTLIFNSNNQTGRRMNIWGSDFYPIANLTHQWVAYQDQITSLVLFETQNTSKWLYAQCIDGSGNYSVPIACNEVFHEPRVLKSIDLMRIDGGTSASMPSSASYRSGAQIQAYLVGRDQYGCPYALDEIVSEFEYNVVQDKNIVSVTRTGTLFTINCGLIGGATLVITNTHDTSISAKKGFVVTQAGVLCRIEVGGAELLKSGDSELYSAKGYDEAATRLRYRRCGKAIRLATSQALEC